MYRKDKKREFYTLKAKEHGYPARSVYKLKEIDERFDIIKEGNIILDLGVAPGSWLKYISEKIGEEGLVIGIDINDIKIELNKNMVFLKRDILKDSLEEDFLKILQGKKFDNILADLSPKTTGIKEVDQGKSLELAKKSFEIALNFLSEKGFFVFKIFESQDSHRFMREVSKYFKDIYRIKPKAISKGSKEFYIVGKEFKSNGKRN